MNIENNINTLKGINNSYINQPKLDSSGKDKDFDKTKEKVNKFVLENKQLLFLTNNYSVVESNEYSFTGKFGGKIKKIPLRFYPTQKVKDIFINVQNNNLDLRQELLQGLRKGELKMGKDTIHYYPKDVASQLQISIHNNNLLRNGEQLAFNTNYMFVLSQEGNLLVKQKERPKGDNLDNVKGGRVHHSSLVRGEPVIAAGTIEISKLDNGSQKLVITNTSGHYKPNVDSLNTLLEWLNNQGLNFNKVQDKIDEKTREITLHFFPE